MVKAVVAEGSRCNLIEEKLSRAAIPSQVGLVIGKLSKILDRGFVFDLIPTPQNEAGESASSLIEGVTKDDKNKGSKTKSQSQSSALFIDKDWVAEHARQVSRMLLGGMKVIGVYIWVGESLFKNSTLTLCQTVKEVAQATSVMDSDSDDRLLIHISYSPRRWICRNCALSSNITSSNLRPCDFKMGKVLASLQRLKCTYNFHLRLPIFFGNGLKTRKFLDVVQIGLSSHEEVLKGAKCLIDGRLVIEDDQSVPDGLHEVELLLPFMQDKNIEACSQKDVFGLVVFSGGLSSIAYLNPKEPLSQALDDIKEDIIGSLQSRLDLMFDEADQESEEGDKEADHHHHMSSGKNIASTDPKSQFLLFPRRVFVPWLEDTFICDYIQPSETIEVVKEHCLELMSLKAPEGDWKILEAECEAIGARFNTSFWDKADGGGGGGGYSSSTSESNEQNLLPDSVHGKATSRASSRSLNLNIIIALLVLVVSIIIGTILFLFRS